MPGASFKTRVVQGSAWILTLQISTQLVSFLRVIVLARVLSPGDFGVFGYAFLVLSTLDAFTKTGFREALIQKKIYDEKHLNVVWSSEIVRSLVIFIVMQLSASTIALFFNTPAIEGLIRVIGCTFIIQSTSNIGMLTLEKSLEFKKVFILEFAGVTSDLAATILVAIITRSPWAMVIGIITGSIVRCGISYIVHDFRPKFSLDLDTAKELFPYSKWIFKTSILGFFIGQSDSLVVGKMLGATQLGSYQLANTISGFPMSQFAVIISKISFPAFSEIQDDREKLCRVYIKMMKVLSLALLPIVAGIVVFIPDFVRLFLNPKWSQIVPLVQIMIFGGMMRPLSSVQDTILLAIGKPSFSAKIQFYRVLTLVSLIYPLVVILESKGVAIAIVVSMLVTVIAFSVKTSKALHISRNDYVKSFILFIVSLLALTVLAILIKGAFSTFPDLVGFCLSVLFFLIVYTLISFWVIRRDKDLMLTINQYTFKKVSYES